MAWWFVTVGVDEDHIHGGSMHATVASWPVLSHGSDKGIKRSSANYSKQI